MTIPCSPKPRCDFDSEASNRYETERSNVTFFRCFCRPAVPLQPLGRMSELRFILHHSIVFFSFRSVRVCFILVSSFSEAPPSHDTFQVKESFWFVSVEQKQVFCFSSLFEYPFCVLSLCWFCLDRPKGALATSVSTTQQPHQNRDLSKDVVSVSSGAARLWCESSATSSGRPSYLGQRTFELGRF